GQKCHATHYKDVLAIANAFYLQGGKMLVRGLSLFDLEWGNIQAGYAWVAAQAVELDEDVARLGMWYPGVGAFILHLRQHARERILWLEMALAAAKQLRDRVREGNALGNLGLAYAALGETKYAIQFYDQALLIHSKLGDRLREGIALGNLGNAYADLGETKRAIQFYEQQLSIAREIGDRRCEGMALGNLGIAYGDLGETNRAIQLFQQQLTIDGEIGDRRG